MPEELMLCRSELFDVEVILRPVETPEDDVIPNEAFPTGAVVLDDGTLEVYLGLNDAVTAVARAPLDDVCGACVFG